MADTHNIPPQVLQAMQRGNLIEAIKLLRQQKPQLGLAEAKALIEAIQRQANVPPLVQKAQARVEGAMHAHDAGHPPRGPAHPLPSSMMNPHVSPGEVPRTGSGSVFAVMVIAIVVVVAAAVYFGR
jgi:hypothetical protein